MSVYVFNRANLLDVMDHANSLDIIVSDLLLSVDTYTMTTKTPFPPEQVDHLGMTEV